MFPLRLSIEGLYSYQTKQVVDFEKLTSHQLFGIFGKVGSGKSSILEAIIYAIYGNSERLNPREERHYNMMNLRSTEMKISLECLAGKNNRERFLFEIKTQRKKNNFSQISPPEKSICLWDEAEKRWIPTSRTPEEIIGMKYDHFRTTVIIPQGKFKEFVEKTDKERTEMMKELFQLEKFDLSDKVKALKIKNQADLKEKEGRLAVLADVSPEKIAEYQTLLEQKTTELAQHQASYEKITQEVIQLENLRKLVLQQQETERLYQQHLEKEPDIQQKQHTIEKYHYFQTHLRPMLLQIKESQKAYEEHEKYIEKLQKTLKEKEVLLNEKKCAAEKATQDFNQKGELEKKLEDFTRIIEIRKKDEQRQPIHQKALEVEAELIRKQSEQKKWLDEIVQHEKEMNAISQHHINIELLNEIKEWYVQDTLLKKELDEKNRAVLQLEEEIQQCWQEKNTALLESGFVADLEFTEALKQLTIRQAAIEQEKETLTRKLDALKWQVELSRLRQHLVEGEPCPLCGSLEHSITEKHSSLLLEKVTEKQEELKTIEKKLHLILSLQSKITHLAQRFGEAQLNKQEREVERDEKYKAYQDHQAKFYWGDFSIYDQPRVEKLIKEYHQQQTTLQKYRETLTDLRKKLDLIQQHVHQLDVKFATQQQEVLGLEKYIEEEKSKLQVLDYFSFTSRPIPDLENNLQKGREKLTAIEQNFVRTREELNQAEIEFNNVNSKIINEQEAARKLSRTINSLQATLDEKMASNPFFENEQQLEAMMSEQIQPIKLQQEILAYYEKKAILENDLEKIRQAIGNAIYQEEHYQRLKEESQLLNHRIIQLTQDIGALKSKIADIESKLTEKKRLEEEKRTLETRKTNLDTLEDLFKGKGFVEFVSVTYLKNLVAAANQRFSKLTYHQLSLELDEKNDFIVRDYLNEGKTRLLKTLSGGQMFQACLCLALALAENVKSLNQAERSFFFIDEGFGSLDKESLKIVFETLKSLQRENRVVGVISHVEELQQEIDVFLHVEKDEKNGSIIRPSWELP